MVTADSQGPFSSVLPNEPFADANLPQQMLAQMHKQNKLDFEEAWWMLVSQSFAGVGVRPDNIPPTEVEAFRGAIMKELPHQHSRRKRKRRSRYALQPDSWLFKGGPKRASRRRCKLSARRLLRARFTHVLVDHQAPTASHWWSAATAASHCARRTPKTRPESQKGDLGG